MDTQYLYLEHAFVAASDQALADGYADRIGMGAGNITVPLSPTGAGPATSYGVCVRITESQRQSLDQLVAAGAVPSLVYYRQDALTDALLATNDPAVTVAGQPWSWDQSIAARGLVKVQTPSGGPV